MVQERDIERERLLASLSARLFGDEGEAPMLGRFRLGAPLGEGAMGAVYRAEDPDLGRPVALKLLRGRTDDVARRRLVREAQALARLNHPNVVTVYEVGRVEDRSFIAMELVDGPDLRRWCAAQPPGSRARFEAALRMTLDAAQGLAAAHAAGVVHRDFKPHNVLIDGEGRLKIADFGLAWQGDPAVTESARLDQEDRDLELDSTQLTGTGQLVGTPAYMAPEQFEGRTDARSDQFSFCATFFEVLFGVRPYAGTTVAQLRTSIDAGHLVPTPAAGVPRHVRAVLERGLHPRPASRFDGMADLHDALVRGRARARRRPVWIAGVGLAAAAGMSWWALGSEPGRCELDRSALQDAWGQERRTLVADSIRRTRSEYADTTARRVVEVLDEFVEGLEAQRLETCDSPDGGTAWEGRRGCFEQGLIALHELTTALADVDSAALSHAPEVALAIADTYRCDDEENVTRGEAPVALAASLAKSRAMSALRRADEAYALARPVAVAAEAQQLHHMHAATSVLLAGIERQRSRLGEAIE